MENNRFRGEPNFNNEPIRPTESQKTVDPTVMKVIFDFQVHQILKEAARKEFMDNMNA